jgi:hypothetical protein
VTRYVSMPHLFETEGVQAAFEYDMRGQRSSTANVAIIVDDPHQPVKTGLVDKNGVPIYRVPETVPMGFRK